MRMYTESKDKCVIYSNEIDRVYISKYISSNAFIKSLQSAVI